MRNKEIIILANYDVGLYNFRLELIQELLRRGYEVTVSSPYGEKIECLKQMGVRYIPVKMERHGVNIWNELKLLFYYLKLLKIEKPYLVLTYTIKPNIYGGLSARINNIPYIENITGLGSALENKNLLNKVLILLYKISVKRADYVFFQNKKNLQFFIKNKIIQNNYGLIPGSGVNTRQFPLLSYPMDKTIEFVFISRIMREKGINEYLKAASIIKKKFPYTRFHICGFCEEAYENIIKNYEKQGVIIYHGMVDDIRKILNFTHCTIHPSYHEGMSNVCLESASSGRPIITTNIDGCKETVKENVSGFLVEPGDLKILVKKIEEFIHLSWDEKRQMGVYGRNYVKKHFERKLVVRSYMKQINEINKRKDKYVNI